jgi:hypothetical protein
MEVEKIFERANKLDNFIFALALKCEICGPKLKGYKGNYPECPKHDISDYIGPRD